MCFFCCLLFLLYQAKSRYSGEIYLFLNVLLFATSILLAFFFGHKGKYGKLQEGISNCPIVTSISYLLGFNLGILYFSFRANKQKPKLLIMQALKYKSFRILLSIFALSVVSFTYWYFMWLSTRVS
jgi:Na+-driven multidrug efflux pump